MSVELNTYLLDIVFAVEGGVQMKTYSIAGESASGAYERFMNEEATDFPIVYEGVVTSAIIIGVQQRG